MNKNPNGPCVVTPAAGEATFTAGDGKRHALPPSPVVAEVIRSGFTESLHRGRIAALGADGRPVIRAGAVEPPFFPRSANKPLQAAAMLTSGAAS